MTATISELADRESHMPAADEVNQGAQRPRRVSGVLQSQPLVLAVCSEPFLERHGLLAVRRAVELLAYPLWDAMVVLSGNGSDCVDDGACAHPCLDSRRLVVYLEAVNVAAGHSVCASKLLHGGKESVELGRNLLAIRDLARTAKIGVLRSPFMCWILNRAYISLFVRLMFMAEAACSSRLLSRLARPYAESQADLREHDKYSKFGCRVDNVEPGGWRRNAELRHRIVGHRFCSPLGITQRLTNPGAERLSMAECVAVARKLDDFEHAEKAQMREEAVQSALLEVAGVLVTHLTPCEARLNARLLGKEGPFDPSCTKLVGKALGIIKTTMQTLENAEALRAPRSWR